jgi:ethanolamine utilization protein EutN
LFLGKVIGNIVSTVKIKDYEGFKLLLVQPIQPEGSRWKDPLICIDIVDSGVGETVLYVDEGNSARQLLGLEPVGAVRAVIVGIVDEIQWQDAEGRLQSRSLGASGTAT